MIDATTTRDAALYDRRYFEDRGYGRDPRRGCMYNQERRRIAGLARGGRILDVGCGLGEFLAGFDDRWERYGYEPSAYAAATCLARGIVMYETIGDVVPGSMDVVVIRGSLQHMANPVETLALSAFALRRGGLLAILATPDADSLVYRTWGRLPALDPPRNWVVFGERNLRAVLDRLGIAVTAVAHPYWRTPYARPLADLARFAWSLVAGWRPFAFPGNMMEVYGVKR